MIGEVAQERGLQVATAESCTGGRVAAALTARAGASRWFAGGVVAYSNDFKSALLNVPPPTIAQYGAVSEETARAMCEGLRQQNATACLSVTGIAGPDGGSDAKPVGTVCFGFAIEDEVFSVTKHFGGDRESIQAAAAEEALTLMAMLLSQMPLPKETQTI